MTILEWYNKRIAFHMERMREAEKAYHHAVQHGTLQDMHEALAECQKARSRVLLYIAKRDKYAEGSSENHV